MKTVILNPKYILRNDHHRVLLSRVFEVDLFGQDVHIFIHPHHAIFLSFFDGKKDYAATLQVVSEVLSITIDDAERLAGMFLTSRKIVHLKYDGESFTLPSDLLIENSQGVVRNDISPDMFECTTPYDFKTPRLSFPLDVLLLPYLKCYTDCVYCYADRKHPYTSLYVGRLLEVIDECKYIGVRNIDVSGGEFLMCPDWKTIIQKLSDDGFRPDISTKLPISEATVDFLVDVGVKTIQFSLDTLDDGIASETLKTPSGYVNRMQKSIRYADKKGLRIAIKPTLTTRNCSVNNLGSIFDFCDSLENIRHLVIFCAAYPRFKNPDEFRLLYPSSEKLEECNRFVEHKINKGLAYPVKAGISVSNRSALCNADHFASRSMCTGNISKCTILPDGKVTYCEEMYWTPDFLLGDISYTSLRDVWNSEVAVGLWKKEQAQFPSDSACSECASFVQCRQGRGVCHKYILEVFGASHPFYPDPRCPKAPKPLVDFFPR